MKNRLGLLGMRSIFRAASILAICLPFSPPLKADEPAPKNPPAKAKEVVAAMVNGQAIYVSEIERKMKRTFKDRRFQPKARTALEAKTLQQLIAQRLVLDYLIQQKIAASSQDIDLEISRFERRLKQRESSLKNYLFQQNLREQQLRFEMRWRISWRQFLETYLTDENLNKYFEQNRADFDGTQIRAAHILLKIDPSNEQAATLAVVTKAKQIQEAILADEISFAEAAAKHSEAPTAKKGGDIGFISRHEPMPEVFSKAAFGLRKGGISEPVVSPFGVHLIQCLEIKPGKKTFKDVRSALERAVAEYLFQWASDRGRPNAKIEFTGQTPYYDPSTGELLE